MFARASSDDKGPIMMFLAAFDGLKQMGVDPAFNVKVLLDSEEEKGSPSIPSRLIRRAAAFSDLGEPEVVAATQILYDGSRTRAGRQSAASAVDVV